MNQSNSSTYVSLDWVKTSKMVLAATLSPLGILSSLLAFSSLWRSIFGKSSSFFVYLTLVSFFDLLFNCTYIVIKWGDSETWFYAICHALCFTASYASDLCSLALTAERYVKIQYPQVILSGRRQTIVYTAIEIIIGLISSTRLRYMAVDPAVKAVTPAWISAYVRPASRYIGFVSDTGLPVLGVAMMTFFSTQIARVVIKRADKQKVIPVQPRSNEGNSAPSQSGNQPIGGHPVTHPTVSQQAGAAQMFQQKKREKEAQAAATISLILVLDLFFLLNQIGYCISSGSAFYNTACDNCPSGNAALSIGSFVCDLAECFSHSLNFYFYLRFSSLIKTEFRQFWATVARFLRSGGSD